MSSAGWDCRFEIEGVGSWPVLELEQRTPAGQVAPIFRPADFELSWREEDGVLYMDAVGRGPGVIDAPVGPAEPAEIHLLLAAGLFEFEVLIGRPEVAFVLRVIQGGESTMAGRGIVVALRCACAPHIPAIGPCYRTELLLVVTA